MSMRNGPRDSTTIEQFANSFLGYDKKEEPKDLVPIRKELSIC